MLDKFKDVRRLLDEVQWETLNQQSESEGWEYVQLAEDWDLLEDASRKLSEVIQRRFNRTKTQQAIKGGK